MTAASGFRDISPDEAERMVDAGSVCVLDVRTPDEYRRLGHIPGSLLLPVDLIAAAPATLVPNGRPLLVCCEHGIRSAAAAEFLARAGMPEILNLAGGMSCWRGARDHAPGDPAEIGPSSWLLECADLLPRGGRVLDVACGRGRHALLLAGAGLSVRAVDADAAKVAALAETAARLSVPIEAEALDLEAENTALGEDEYDLILVVRYLHRPLFPAILSALKPGGVLLYETFTVDQAERGRPTNPDYLLRHGELADLVAPFEIVRKREGEYEGKMVSGVAARKSST